MKMVRSFSFFCRRGIDLERSAPNPQVSWCEKLLKIGYDRRENEDWSSMVLENVLGLVIFSRSLRK